jgi:hypothetical protein
MRCVSDRRPCALAPAIRMHRSAITPCASHASPIACKDREHHAFQIRTGFGGGANPKAVAGPTLNFDRTGATRLRACRYLTQRSAVPSHHLRQFRHRREPAIRGQLINDPRQNLRQSFGEFVLGDTRLLRECLDDIGAERQTELTG